MERLAREVVKCFEEVLQPLHILVELLLLLAVLLLRHCLALLEIIRGWRLIRKERSLLPDCLSPGFI